MVWPSLISPDVTPRISAACAASGHASNAAAPAMQTLPAKRIDPLPRLIFDRSMTAARDAASGSISLSPKHDMAPGWMPFIIAAASQRDGLAGFTKTAYSLARLKIIAGYTSSRATRYSRQSPLSLVPSFEILRGHARGMLGGRAASCRRRRRSVSRKALAQFVPLANPRRLPRFWLRLSQSVRPDTGEGRLSQGNVERRAFGQGGAKDTREGRRLVRSRGRPRRRHGRAG